MLTQLVVLPERLVVPVTVSVPDTSALLEYSLQPLLDVPSATPLDDA